MWNTVLFDLDGTLTDSGEGIKKCVQYATEKALGFTETREEVLKTFVGPPLLDSFMKYDGVTEEDAKRAIAAYRERYQTKGIYENQLYPGVAEMLADLKKAGYRIALTSSKPDLYCRQILGFFGIIQYFDIVVGAPMDESQAAKPALIDKTLTRLAVGVDTSHVVMVGDRKYDIDAAKQYRLHTVGVRYGYAPAGELENCAPDAIVGTVDELRFYLLRQRNAPDPSPRRSYFRQQEYDQRGTCSPCENADYGGGSLHGGGNSSGGSYDYGNGSTQGPDDAYRRTDFGGQGYSHGGQYGYSGQPRRKTGRARIVWHTIWPLALAAIIEIAVGLLYGVFDSFSGHTLDPNSADVTFLLTGIMDACFLVVFALIFRQDEKKRRAMEQESALLKTRGFRWLDGIFTVCGMLAVSFLGDLIVAGLTKEGDSYTEFSNQIAEEHIVIAILLIGVLGPIAEEFLFRGVFYRRLREATNIYVAVIVSAGAFGAFHGNLSQGVAAAVMGIALALIYEHYGTLKASITAHMAVNIFGVISMHYGADDMTQGLVGAAVLIFLVAGVFSLYHIFWVDEKVNRV
ncbi:MAG: HAD hydrolase-like protein [Lachnospiraceae bacterium]|nr:HAD hydrolase-like protein [Lachnospiraceae bacterium]